MGILTAGCTGSVHQQSPTSTAPPAVKNPPNIILILADDLGIGDTGRYGSEVIRTPHIDRLANRGVLFSQAYVSHPVCSPSRAGLMTGQYQQRHGWEFNPAGRDAAQGMATDPPTLANMLQAAGYATGMVGKWHLGQQNPHHPLNRGFESFFGVLHGGALFIDPNAAGVESMGSDNLAGYARVPIYRQQRRVTEAQYLTDAFTREAVQFIQQQHARPFFLYLSHTTPHTPLQATAKYLDRYRHIEDKATRIYAAMVASLDDSVGAVVQALRDGGQLDNTLIVFSSDNGCAGYLNGACSNAPFAGFKRYHQEGGIRVPLIVSWPQALPMHRRFEAPVSLLDLWATFAAAAKSTSRTPDSVNLLPYLHQEAQQETQSSAVPHDYLYWRSGPTIAIRDARWKLIRYNRWPQELADNDSAGRLLPPEGGWPSGSPHGQLTLLYDLQQDPGETRNLANQHPAVVQRLLQRHLQWSTSLTSPLLPAIRSSRASMHGETVQLLF